MTERNENLNPEIVADAAAFNSVEEKVEQLGASAKAIADFRAKNRELQLEALSSVTKEAEAGKLRRLAIVAISNDSTISVVCDVAGHPAESIGMFAFAVHTLSAGLTGPAELPSVL